MATLPTPLSLDELRLVAHNHGYEPAAVRAVMEVEGGGHGFSEVTGRILIQFEPYWFRQFVAANITQQLATITKLNAAGTALTEPQATLQNRWTLAMSNKVSDQTLEFKAFSAAFQISPQAAMKGTSWGLGQIMGHHYSELGFKFVDEFVDYSKVSEANQLELMMRFVANNPALDKALKIRDWDTFAYRYNGKNYKGDPTTFKDDYDYKLRQAYARFSVDKDYR